MYQKYSIPFFYKNSFASEQFITNFVFLYANVTNGARQYYAGDVNKTKMALVITTKSFFCKLFLGSVTAKWWTGWIDMCINRQNPINTE